MTERDAPAMAVASATTPVDVEEIHALESRVGPGAQESDLRVGEDGGSAPPPLRRRGAWRWLHGLSWLVLLLVGMVSVLSTVTVRGIVRDQERRQLAVKASEATLSLTGSLTSQSANLSALLAVSDRAATYEFFDRIADPLVTPLLGQPATYSSVLALRRSPAGPVVTAAAGDIAEKTVLSSGPRADAVEAAWTTPGVMHTTSVFMVGGSRRLGFAKAAAGGGAVYAEAFVPRYAQYPSSGAFHDVSAALYASPTPDPDQFLISTTGTAITGHTVKVPVSAGAEKWLVVAAARKPLVGSTATALPWVILAGGILGAILATFTVETLTRRRDYASELVAERTIQLRTANENLKIANEQLENRVAERTARLNASNKELEAFAYTVAHDLRTPLRAIDGFSKALLDDYTGKLDEQAHDYLDRVRAAAQRMGILIDDLLGLSRVARTKTQVQRVDLTATAREILGGFHDREPLRRVEDVVADGLTVDGDPTLLRVLLENLLGNAWKFTATREAARIELGETYRDREQVFFVRDNGVGFDMKFASKLFTPFERLHTSEQYVGTGIGLATADRVVRRHGGRLWAEAEVDKGATFYFTLAGWTMEA